MKSGIVLALLVFGLLLRMQGWQFLAHRRTLTGSLLVLGGTLVTLSIIALLAVATGT